MAGSRKGRDRRRASNRRAPRHRSLGGDTSRPAGGAPASNRAAVRWRRVYASMAPDVCRSESGFTPGRSSAAVFPLTIDGQIRQDARDQREASARAGPAAAHVSYVSSTRSLQPNAQAAQSLTPEAFVALSIPRNNPTRPGSNGNIVEGSYPGCGTFWGLLFSETSARRRLVGRWRTRSVDSAALRGLVTRRPAPISSPNTSGWSFSSR